MLILFLLWSLFWELVYFYHTLIFVKFHYYAVRHPALWPKIFQHKASFRAWLCWEGLLLWIIVLPLGMAIFLAWLWQTGTGKEGVLFALLIMIGGPVSMRWADAQIPRLFQQFGTVDAKRWTLEGLPVRYLRFLSAVLFRRKSKEAEQTGLLFYLTYFTDQEQELLFFGEKAKKRKKRR